MRRAFLLALTLVAHVACVDYTPVPVAASPPPAPGSVITFFVCDGTFDTAAAAEVIAETPAGPKFIGNTDSEGAFTVSKQWLKQRHVSSLLFWRLGLSFPCGAIRLNDPFVFQLDRMNVNVGIHLR